MDRREIETAVREWLDRTSVDPRTALPPDAKVSVNAAYISTIGHLAPGQSEPDSGVELWSVTATLYFPDSSPSWDDPDDQGLAIAQVLDRLQSALERDPTLNRPGIRATWRGTDGDEAHERPGSPPSYLWAVDVGLSVQFLAT